MGNELLKEVKNMVPKKSFCSLEGGFLGVHTVSWKRVPLPNVPYPSPSPHILTKAETREESLPPTKGLGAEGSCCSFKIGVMTVRVDH